MEEKEVYAIVQLLLLLNVWYTISDKYWLGLLSGNFCKKVKVTQTNVFYLP